MFNHQGQLRQFDTIVVGSGISGLTTALIFAKEGKKVALFERDQDIAPLIRPYKRRGCEFSPGLHISGWMGEAEILASFLNYLNVSDGVERKLYEDGLGQVIVNSRQYFIPKGLDKVEDSLLAYFPESMAVVRNYMRLVKEDIEESFYFNHQLTPDIKSTPTLMSSDSYSLLDRLKEYDAPQDLIDLLGALNYFLLGSRADEVPFLKHAHIIGGFYHSPGYFTISGINRLLANFKRELSRYNVCLNLSSEVAEILVDQAKNVTGIRTLQGDQYSAPIVVASFNPKLLPQFVKDDKLRAVYMKRLAEAENTFGLYVAFYKFATTNDVEIKNVLYRNDHLGITFGILSHRNREPKILNVFLTDEGNIPISMEERRARADEKLAILENILYEKIPELKDNIVLLDFLKPWSFERYTHTVNGSAYGIKQTLNSFGFKHKVPINGLYLVGQAIYTGFLGSILSGFNLALELFDSKELWARILD